MRVCAWPVMVVVSSIASGASGCSCGATHVPPDADIDARAGEIVDLDIVGRWHDCSNTLVFGTEGDVTRRDHRTECTASGTYEVTGNRLEVLWTAPCAGGGAERWSRELVRAERGFVAVDPADGRTSRWADDTHPIETLSIRGEAGEETIARIVATPGTGFGSGCYWSADGACGGLFSCAGVIQLWSFEGDSLTASTSCGGECPCGARITGSRAADGSIAGTYRGANCERVLSGTFEATPLGP
jgi:hypothetical protein